MNPAYICLVVLVLAPPIVLQAADTLGDVPAFSGPTPGVLRTISIPTVDISGDTERHVIVARGTDKDYQGHCDTVLMGDGKTMFAAWCMNHAGHLGPLARSDDGGLTWSPLLNVPANWQEVQKTTPVIHRLTDPHGVERLFLIGGCDFPGNIRRSVSEDGGKTWAPMVEVGLVGEVAPKSILPFDDGKRLIMWSDRRDPRNAKDPHPVVWQSESLDGGLTWSNERIILIVPGQWAQPSVIRSADQRRLLMLMRENTRKHNSLYSLSTDDARNWSEPKELPAALTGDRHVIKRAPDGRLVVAFRDMAKTSNTYGHYVAWVGTFEDIENGREGQYRIKLLHNANRTASDSPGAGNTDCGYSDLELLDDGTITATTYIKYADGPEKSSVVSTRFKLSETDALVKQTESTAVVPNGLSDGENVLLPMPLDATRVVAPSSTLDPSSVSTRSWQKRVAAHAGLLSSVKWTPVADTLPTRKGGFFEKGIEYVGVPYSSVRSEGRNIGFDIALRTFLAAVENPSSVIYTENLSGKVPNAAAYYGSVCSAYTSYALGCGFPEVSRRYGPEIKTGVVLVHPQSAHEAQVGDVIYTPHATKTSGSHVEIITDVKRDQDGRVRSVRVEESRPPTTRITDRTSANLDAHLAERNKQLFRIANPDAWRGDNRAESLRFPNFKLDAEPPTINRALLLDLGDWVPYQKTSPVKFNVMDRDHRGVKALVIRRGGEVVEEIAIDGPGLHERRFDICGDYTADVIHTDGTSSTACEFAVCDLELSLPSDHISIGNDWQVNFKAENMDVIAVYLWNSDDSYGRHPLFLTPEQQAAGTLTIAGELLNMPGTLQVWLIGEHHLGRLKLRKDIPLVK